MYKVVELALSCVLELGRIIEDERLNTETGFGCHTVGLSRSAPWIIPSYFSQLLWCTYLLNFDLAMVLLIGVGIWLFSTLIPHHIVIIKTPLNSSKISSNCFIMLPNVHDRSILLLWRLCMSLGKSGGQNFSGHGQTRNQILCTNDCASAQMIGETTYP